MHALLRIPLKSTILLMHTITLTVLLSCLPTLLFSQVQIAGIINSYTKVLAIEPCEAKVTVTDPSDFTADAKLLLVQMKGATINTSNSGSFGNIDEIGGAGLYEMNEVKSVSGNDIYLKNELLSPYDPSQGLQLVTVPRYDNALINNVLTAKSWDGETGGVLIFEADNLQFSADIDVTGLGFRGAEKKLVTSDCNFLTNADGFHYNTTNWRGSPKGEGIANLVESKEHGRGAQANGGGGGNDHNSGGGGGGNVTNGGIGGKQSVSGFGCDGDYPGRGGKACPIEPNRIYLGGGGGAGHFDDDGAGSSGGNGGGIAIVIANTIEANGFSIVSNGATPLTAPGDGAGGGGAGGTILLLANDVQGNLTIEAKGGNGSDTNNVPNRCNGPGGGGSGGRLLAKSLQGLNINLEAGQPGVNLTASGQCDGPSNGAEEGEAGVEAMIQALPQSDQEIIATNVLQQPTDPHGCVGVGLEIGFQVDGNYLEYQWQQNYGNGWEDLQNNSIFVGVNSPVLSLTSPAPAMDGISFRCVVTSPCSSGLTSDVVSLELVGATIANYTVDALGNGSYQFQNASENATGYIWDFGDGTSSTEPNPIHQYADFGNYQVTLTATGPCGDETYTSNLLVAVAPEANFTFQNNGICAPQNVQFENLSSSNASNFQWYFPGGEPSFSTAASPSVTYTSQGLFDVTLIAMNAVGNDTITLAQAIEVGGAPLAAFDFDVNNLSVSFFNQSLNATVGYIWDFGDGTTSIEPQPSHQYATQGTYTVTLTAINNCGESTITYEVPTGAFPLAAFTASDDSGCSPLLVQFENQSVGANIVGFQWEFPGGMPSTSNEPNPTVSYTLPGSYSVKLTVTNALGSHELERLDYIQVYQTPTADFTYQYDGYTVTFANTSSGGAQFVWDFGDGNNSQVENPSHTFDNPGNYDVILTAINSNCGSAVSQTIFLEPLDVDATGLAGQVTLSPNPSNNWINIDLGQLSRRASVMTLRSSNGSLLETISVEDKDRLRIDMSAYPNGLYYLQLQVDNGHLLSKRFIKQ